MTRLSKQQICEGMEAGISEWTMHDRVYHQGKTVAEAIAMGPPKPKVRRRTRHSMPSSVLADRYGISASSLEYRMNKLIAQGKSRNQALESIRRAEKRKAKEGR